MSKNSASNTALSVIISTLIIVTFFVSFLFVRDMSKLNNAYSDLNNIEFLSSSTQRLVRLAITNQMDSKSLFFIRDTSNKTLKPDQSATLSVLDDSNMILEANKVLESWSQLENVLNEKIGDAYELILAGDNHFYSMTDLSNAVTDYTVQLRGNILMYQAIITTLLFIIGLVVLNHILRTHTELRQSNLLAQTAQIDVATGLFNRSRCQNLFKNNPNPATTKQPALMVLDLNDLKIVNDTQGHRIGDELISAFSRAMRESINVHVIPPFIGRYGGDEFIVYYDDVSSEEELNFYLNELNFLTTQFNSTEEKFQISYAVGYCYCSHDSQSDLSIREMFDIADHAMYENKLFIKKQRANSDVFMK